MKQRLSPFYRHVCFVLSATLTIPAGVARGDEIDDMRDMLEASYARVIPDITETARLSHPAADKMIDERLNEASMAIYAAFKVTPEAFAREASSPETVACFTALAGYEAGINLWIAKEPTDGTLAAWRNRHYTGADITHLTNAVAGLQRNYVNCLRRVRSLEAMLMAFKTMDKTNISLCPVFNATTNYAALLMKSPFPRHTSVKIDAGAYLKWPTIFVSVGTNFECAKDGEYCDQSNVGVQATKQAQEDTQGKVDQWQRLRAQAPYAVGTITAGILASSLVGMAPLYATGIGALVAVTIALVVALVENDRVKRRIRQLNDWIDDKEEDIRKIVRTNYITEAQFNDKKRAKCGEREPLLKQQVADYIARVDVDKHIKTMRDFHTRTDRLERWYNDLFLWLSEGDQRILDTLARNQLAQLHNKLFAGDYLARAEQEKNAAIAQLNEQQGYVSLFDRCNVTNDRAKRQALRDVKNLVQTYDASCASYMTNLAVKTPQLNLASGEPSQVTCAYEGFAEAKALRISSDAAGGSAIEVLDAANATVARFSGVSSVNPQSTDNVTGGLRCGSADGLAFDALQPGVYALAVAANTLGLAEAQVKDIRERAKLTSKIVRRMFVLCTRQLTGNIQFSIPLEPVACGIDVDAN